MKSCCMDFKCIQCCIETSMPLSSQDITRIKKLGFKTNFFVIKRCGWLQLKNYEGKCVFHNGINCSIYDNRPEGCKLYPIIYNKDKRCAIIDKDCSYADKFKISKRTTRQLYALVSKLESERAKRN